MRLALIALATLIAHPALALSCMRPDAVTLYQTAKTDRDDFYIARGTIRLLEPANDPKPNGMKSTATRTRAEFTGIALNRTGFSTPFERTIVIEANCLSTWCGSAAALEGTEVFAALRLDNDDLILARGPCGGDVVEWSNDGEARLLTCHRDGDCRRAEF